MIFESFSPRYVQTGIIKFCLSHTYLEVCLNFQTCGFVYLFVPELWHSQGTCSRVLLSFYSWNSLSMWWMGSIFKYFFVPRFRMGILLLSTLSPVTCVLFKSCSHWIPFFVCSVRCWDSCFNTSIRACLISFHCCFMYSFRLILILFFCECTFKVVMNYFPLKKNNLIH